MHFFSPSSKQEWLHGKEIFPTYFFLEQIGTLLDLDNPSIYYIAYFSLKIV
jgi:hypothetical protein